MKAIYLRELRAYFKGPLGFVFIGASCLFSGLYFYAYNLYAGSTSFSSLFSTMFSVVLFLIPVLTMRLLSEERRQRTDQLLMTAPVSSLEISLGKYLSALCVYVLATASTLLDALVFSAIAQVNWVLVAGNYTGLLLLGAALIAICMFLSSLTESQLIAAVSGFCVSLMVILTDALAPLVDSPAVQTVLGWINFSTRYTPFTYGVFALENAVFFLSIAALFVYLTVARLERRRWS